MVGQHHRLNGHEFEQTPGDSEEQGSLACYSPWAGRVRHDLVTEQQQYTKLNHVAIHLKLTQHCKSTTHHKVVFFLIY